MNAITYTPAHGASVTLPVGRDCNVSREGACVDICLTREVAIDCPLAVEILIRTNGDIVLWGTTWTGNQPSHTNTYWHFAALSDEQAQERRPTDGQLATLERMFLGLAKLPGDLHGALGRPVASWAFAGQTADTIAKKHGVRTPVLA